MTESTPSPPAEPPPGRGVRGDGTLLLLALALGLGLVRFFQLGRWSLWFDEAVTLADAHHGIDSGSVYNPLGYLAIRSTVEWLGGPADEFALRLLPAICGWLVIPLAYWAFRPWAGGRRAAAAALFLAVSSWQVYWSQNARFYTMTEAVTLLGGGLFLRGLLGGVPWKAALGALVVAAASLLHLQAVLLFAVLVVAPWVVHLSGTRLDRGARRAALVVAGLALVGIALRVGWALQVWDTYRLAKRLDAGFGTYVTSVAHFVLTLGFFITPLFGVAFLVGAVGALRARDPFHVLAVVVVVVFATAGIVAGLFARVSAQYAFVLLPWIAIVAAWPLESRPLATAPRARLAYVLLITLPALADTGLYFATRHGERPRWREAYEYVWSQRQEDDLVLGMAASVGEYYLAPGRTDLRDPRVVSWLDEFHAHVPDQWVPFGRRIWFVIRPEYLKTWRSEDLVSFQRLLREECRLMRRFPVPVEGRDLSVEVYLREGS